MIHQKSCFNRIRDQIGPGGFKCFCCRPGKRHIKKMYRRAKRRERAWFQKYCLD